MPGEWYCDDYVDYVKRSSWRDGALGGGGCASGAAGECVIIAWNENVNSIPAFLLQLLG